MLLKEVSYRFPTKGDELGALRKSVSGKMTQMGFSERYQLDISLALGEIYYHASRSRLDHEQIARLTVMLRIHDDHLEIVVDGYPADVITHPHAHLRKGLPIDAVEDTEFAFKVMKTMADEVKVENNGLEEDCDDYSERLILVKRLR